MAEILKMVAITFLPALELRASIPYVLRMDNQIDVFDKTDRSTLEKIYRPNPKTYFQGSRKIR